MQVELYQDHHDEQFADMFVSYFVNDFHAPFPEETIREAIVPRFVELSKRKVAPILIAFEDDVPLGFVCFQIDSSASDWNERPGWGMLRELYVDQRWRRRGVGSVLATVAVRAMAESGATQAYLTTEDAFGFWESLGWQKTEAVAPNGGTVMELVLEDHNEEDQ